MRGYPAELAELGCGRDWLAFGGLRASFVAKLLDS